MTNDLRRSADAFRASDFVLTEIAKLQAAGEYTKHELGELRTEVRDLRTEVRDLRTDVRDLQTAGEYTKRELVELRTDVRDLRMNVRDLGDRMSKLEVRVDHLPSKGFIVVVVTIALTIIGGLLSVAPKLQSWTGAASVLSAPQSQSER
jgi:chromosome segregation ATPase